MGDNAPETSEPFDLKKVKYLVRLMKHYDLTDLDISDGPARIHLQRRGPELAIPASAFNPPAGSPLAYPQHAVAPSASPAPQPAPQEAAGPKTIVIESPMVGTYYSSSAPDTPPFVSVGTAVQPSSTLCIIEAMKVFTDIPAGVSGTIAEILVKSGQPVEFGQPLFRVVPA
ncbi:acetyl-CoA carboxylase biotin carboxyl carrier protein [Paludisphaera borealis]|uniref:Biotin carboxyl carrier protein of acetyl-CoA carboxylase n=1 Tax=Paludisphaera borealis TaxID=1387353 RepID=A0A1U7CIH5_9BACT|nr:acetyl-CoA carboxylase biotin carboxyl carrier protein [Paludisphaera borealis]APW58706.1 Biotin carboxyl carrier protein of acetyl-CoA carboxylase [Paludisphaera borealis]MDR3621062.1 acetyl-CoA carboxylase biotin carboxyl carrier protein [Paludisphaera borealis]